MARIIWNNLLLPNFKYPPSYFSSDIVPHFPQDIQVQRLEIDHTNVDLPSIISRRSLSRTGILLNLVTLSAASFVEKFLTQDRFSVGIYGAIEPGPTDFTVAKCLAMTSESDFTKTFKTEMSPKTYFFSMPNMPIAQIAIYLKSQGRASAYTHSRLAATMALEQAKWDLKVGTVKAALVCGAFSLENPFVVLRENNLLSEQEILCEGAAAVLMIADDTDKPARPCNIGIHSFGNINELIYLIKGDPACKE